MVLAHTGRGQAQGSKDIKVQKLSVLIEQALEQNPSVGVVRNRWRQADNMHSIQPFLPSLGGTARYNKSNSNSKRVFNEQEQDFENTTSENVSAGLSLSWTIFDGLECLPTISAALTSLMRQNLKLAGWLSSCWASCLNYIIV